MSAETERFVLKQIARTIIDTVAQKAATLAVERIVNERMFFGDTWMAFKPIQPAERLLGVLLPGIRPISKIVGELR